MSEPELATKAPETDAAELSQPSAISGYDTRAQAGQSMGEHCTSNRPVSADRQSFGEITEFNNVETYVSKPADYPNTPGRLLLLLTGGTGVHSINNQLQADMFAKKGYVVVMPDQFSGDPAPKTMTEEEKNDASLIEQIKMGLASTAKSFLIDMWLARHTPEKVLPILHKVLDAIKDEYADSVAHGDGIYAAGYCFGARYVVILAGQHPDTVMHGQAATDEEQGVVRKGPIVKVGAIAHATSVTREELSAIKVPVSMVCVENDPLFPEEILEDGKKSLTASGTEHEIKTYPGVPHGFAVVGDYDSATISKSQSDAFEQMANWLNNH